MMNDREDTNDAGEYFSTVHEHNHTVVAPDRFRNTKCIVRSDPIPLSAPLCTLN